MKDIQTLLRLAKNPFYVLSAEDERQLSDYQAQQESSTSLTTTNDVVSSDEPTTDLKKKKAAVAVKETGKLDKHPADPAVEE